MKKCFILASSDDRIHLLERCIQCAKESQYAKEDFFLYYQGKDIDKVKGIEFFKDIVTDTKLRGVFTPRYELMKRYCLQYDYTILIDDDLFLKKDTSYERSIQFCEKVKSCGAVAISHNTNDYRNEMRCVSGTRQYMNICGGMVFPRKSIVEILEYFKDKEKDYTEDVFWLLLYVKGYDLYKDFSSASQHKCNRKSVDGKLTGFNKMRVEKEHVPMMPEWYDSKRIYENITKCVTWKVKEMSDINEKGREERRRNRES